MIEEVIGVTGVFTAEGKTWRQQRKFVMKGFTARMVQKFYPKLAKMNKRLIRLWQKALQEGRQPDYMSDLKALSLDVTIALAMGTDINTLENSSNRLQEDIHFLFETIGRRIMTPFPYWRYFSLKKDKDAVEAAKRIVFAVQGYIKQARDRLSENTELRENPTNLMEAMVVARDEENSGITDEGIVGTALNLVFAGEDTTAATLSWLLNQIAENPDVGARLEAESDKVFGSTMFLEDPTMLDQLDYTEAVLHESMRLRPAAPILVLETIKELVVGDVLLAPGVMLVLTMRVPALKSERFHNPLVFLPDRWLGDSETTIALHRGMTPFGGGPRMCPGRALSLLDTKLILSSIMRHFHVHPAPGAAPVREVLNFTMNPSAVPVILTAR